MHEDVTVGDHERRRRVGMELLRRILSCLGLDCVKHTPSSTPSSRAAPAESADAERDPPHCQSCIAFDARLKRLACGHLYCGPCTDRIVNQAFQDIEGLSDYPCPMCKSIRRLSAGLPHPGLGRTVSGTSVAAARAPTPLQRDVIREEEEEEEEKEEEQEKVEEQEEKEVEMGKEEAVPAE